ncbi:hypothetical protein SteCoe_17583 [Stentor coeruleus]|uniref:TNFR-Cys domain-containing protein n=1 Tax=Stentor coeruleus TaxID=5963 RepID=A0A1R2BYK8_9CILI|nr:hypothetical protein SteCoe_17583 [Stentor coeruleus]
MFTVLVLVLTQIWCSTGDILSLSTFSNIGGYVNFVVSVLDINNTIISISGVNIYVYQDPSGVLEGISWNIITTNGTANGLLVYCYEENFSLVAESPGYTSAKSTSIINMNGCHLAPKIDVNSTTVHTNEYIAIDALIMDEYGYVPFSYFFFELVDLEGSTFNSLYQGYAIGEIASTQITFSTPGIKKILVIFDGWVSFLFSIVVSDCINTLEITFPNGFVIITQPLYTLMTFSVQVNILDSITGVLITDGTYDITIDSLPSGINSMSTGATLVTASTTLGTVTINDLYFIRNGHFTITAAYSQYCIGASIQIPVYDNALKISFTSALPSNTTCFFDILVEAYNSDLTVKLTNIYYYVKLILEPSGRIMSEGYTETNEIRFTNLSITTQGEFYLKAVSYNFANAKSDLLDIHNKFYWSITVNASNYILINFDKELSESLTSSDFSLKFNTNSDIIAIFIEESNQNYIYFTYSIKDINAYTSFTLEVIKSNLMSTTAEYFDYTVESATLNPFKKICNNSEYYDPNSSHCIACNENCLECFGPEYYDCYKCKNFLLEGICISECPLGFKNQSSECLPDISKTKIISFPFEGVGNQFYDEIYDIKAVGVTKNSSRRLTDQFYDEIYDIKAVGVTKNSSRRLTETLPYSVYLRGIYFPGESALKIEFSDQKLFSSNFSVSLWLKSECANATLLAKYSGQKTIFKIDIENYFLRVIIEINDILYSLTSSIALDLGWNHLLIAYNSSLGLSIAINDAEEDPIFFTKLPYLDASNSTLYIGSDSLFENAYSGFIYNIDIYRIKPNVSELVESSCQGCSFCPKKKSCIPSCDIGQYYDSSYKKCSSCPKECPDVCKSSDSCSLCADDNCTSCKTYEKNSCIECVPELEVIDYLCYPCTYGFYYSYSTSHCEVCPKLCLNCTSETNCLDCKENSSLNSKSECVCDMGYSLFDTCVRKKFDVIITLSQENVATLIFEEALNSSLKDSQLEISIDKKKVSFTISSDILSTYYITPEISDKVTKSSSLNITIFKNLVSVNNALFNGKQFVASLFVTDELIAEKKLEVKAKAAKATAKTGSTAGVSAALGISFMNFDPTSLFDFLNTAEMFYAVYLMNLNTNKVLSEFLLGLRIQDLLPNAYSYTVDFFEGEKMPIKFQKLGFKRNLVLINGGGQLTTLTIFVALWFIVFLFSKLEIFKPKLEKVLNTFKYSIFLRFWLQTYFELAIVSIFGLKYNKFANPTQIADAVVCLLIIAFQIFILIVMIYSILKRRRLSDENEIKEFEKKFSTFFDEFKSTGLSMWMFYVLYIIRRTLLVFSYLFIDDGSLQLAICISLCLTMPLYAITSRCFKSISQTIYHFLNELLIAAYYCIILVAEVSENQIMSESMANICIKIIIAAWALNIFTSLSDTIFNIIKKIKKCIEKHRDKRNTEVDMSKAKNEMHMNTTKNIPNETMG